MAMGICRDNDDICDDIMLDIWVPICPVSLWTYDDINVSPCRQGHMLTYVDINGDICVDICPIYG